MYPDAGVKRATKVPISKRKKFCWLAISVGEKFPTEEKRRTVPVNDHRFLAT